MTVNGVSGLFMGMTRPHGLSDVIRNGYNTIYKGFYHGNAFEICHVYERMADDYDLMLYIETYNDVEVDDDFTQLIEFVNDKKVLNDFYNTSYYKSKAKIR
jgi:hypothetical protein